MWLINSHQRCEKTPEFCPYPKEKEEKENKLALGNKAMVLQFVKSPSSVNPAMTKHQDIYLQGEDRIFLNVGQSVFGENGVNNSSKQWTTVTIPHNYIGSSWPIRVSKR